VSKPQTPDAALPPSIRLESLAALTPDAVKARLAHSPKAAADMLRAGAEAGLPEAQVMYGQALRDGYGVKADAALAAHWFIKAAEAGYPMGMNMAGRCLDKGWGVAVDQVAAVDWFKAAADAGLDWGMYNYAHALRTGAGVAQDEGAALAWFEKAAGLGHVKSINFVGLFLEDGRAVAPDRAKALDCYRQAAEGGDFRGQFNLARRLAEIGDLDQALAWLARANETCTPDYRETMRRHFQGATEARLREAAAGL
jgi:TPR repeat protein